ncbi:hypothetical protein AAVH_35354, partial [Aphelenchoides avenae]
GFIVNRYDTNKSKRDLAVVYADKCPYDGSGLGRAQGWGCNAALGYGFPLNSSEGNIIYDAPEITRDCYDDLAKEIA